LRNLTEERNLTASRRAKIATHAERYSQKSALWSYDRILSKSQLYGLLIRLGIRQVQNTTSCHNSMDYLYDCMTRTLGPYTLKNQLYGHRTVYSQKSALWTISMPVMTMVIYKVSSSLQVFSAK